MSGAVSTMGPALSVAATSKSMVPALAVWSPAIVMFAPECVTDSPSSHTLAPERLTLPVPVASKTTVPVVAVAVAVTPEAAMAPVPLVRSVREAARIFSSAAIGRLKLPAPATRPMPTSVGATRVSAYVPRSKAYVAAVVKLTEAAVT